MLLVGLALAALSVTAPVPMNADTWITGSDYPPAALCAAEEGITRFRLDVGDAGLPLTCEIERSSGFADLDERTCALLMHRARFEPARDRHGVAVAGGYSGRMAWKIHNVGPPPKSN